MSEPGKVFLVTGAGTRLGSAIATIIGEGGHHVAVHYGSSRSGAENTQARLQSGGSRAELFQADLTDAEQCRKLVDDVLAVFGRLDGIVANAANFERVAVEDVDDDGWNRAMALNLRAPWLMSQRAIPALRKSGGSIVFITCSSATTPYRNYLPYVVSKGGLRQLARVLALELAPVVRVNAVAPGTVLPPEDMDPKLVERIVSKIPLGRVGSPLDVARAVKFLLESPYITGQEIVVDGGASMAAIALA